MGHTGRLTGSHLQGPEIRPPGITLRALPALTGGRVLREDFLGYLCSHFIYIPNSKTENKLHGRRVRVGQSARPTLGTSVSLKAGGAAIFPRGGWSPAARPTRVNGETAQVRSPASGRGGVGFMPEGMRWSEVMERDGWVFERVPRAWCGCETANTALQVQRNARRGPERGLYQQCRGHAGRQQPARAPCHKMSRSCTPLTR